MGFLDKMKSAAGVGTAGLEVDIKARPGKRGDMLDALIRVTPGKEQAFKLNYIRFSFEYNGKWMLPTADGGQVAIEGKGRIAAGDIEASKNLNVEPGQPAVEFPLQLQVPSDSPLSGPDLKYHLWVRADLEGMKDPEHRTHFDITQ